MARSRAEVRAFLESKVNTRVNDKVNSSLNGQCVTLIKALMEFLGVPNPYGARGNAKDAGNSYVAQGIGTAGSGWLNICVNPSMGGGYGHIWVDLAGEANYEQNGAVALRTTKNTRPISQTRQFVNFDKWINDNVTTGGNMPVKLGLGQARILAEGILGRDRNFTHSGKGDGDLQAHHAGRDLTNEYLQGLWQSGEAIAAANKRAAQEAFFNKYQKLIGDLESRPTKAQLEEVATKLAAESARVAKAEEALKAEQAKKSEDTVLLDEAGSWFSKLINRLFKKG
jgi:hypothetical protein